MTRLLLFTVPVSAMVASAGMEYMGCFGGDWLYSPSYVVWFGSAHEPCTEYCVGKGTTYAYHHINFKVDAQKHWCACLNSEPLYGYIEGDNSPCQRDIHNPNDDAFEAEVSVLMPDRTYIGCYQFDLGASKSIDHILDCDALCSGFQYMFWQVDAVDEVTRCSCSDASHWDGRGPSDYHPTTDWYVYQQVLGPSAAAKREQRERARRSGIAAKKEMCPEGMQACNILDGDGLSFECLDIKQELESCGGCLHGEFRPQIHGGDFGPSRSGIDCTSLPGVNPLGITCQDGICVAHSCNEGFVLDGTVCKVP
ncbi:hypothetical protein IAU59_005621 [Kwoniella sp. CBS 9459]